MYWIVSVPYDDDKSRTFKRLKKQLLTESKIANVYEFKIPDLRVGTLDSLMSLSDDLQKYDSTVESITIKILRNLQDVDSTINRDDYVPEIILQEDNKIPVDVYLQYFQWDESQYMLNRPLREITDTIYKKITKFDDELKSKMAEYTTLRTNIQNLERKDTGNLLVRGLDGIIQKEHIVESEYLTTLFVVVPKNLYKQWLNSYDELGVKNIQHIVPGSSELIAEDKQYGLFNVVVLRKMVEDFKNECVKNRFTVRDFTYDETRFELSKLEKEKMVEKLENMRKELVHWCRTGFSEAFSSWIHLKMIRTFVESVLRYGVPPRFVSILIKVNRNEKKIHKFFREKYKYLQEDNPFSNLTIEQQGQVMASMGGLEFHPYVLITINDFFSKSN